MKTVTLEVASRKDITRRALAAFKGSRQQARISFATPELLWKVLTAKFESKSVANSDQLWGALHHSKLRKGEMVGEYVEKLDPRSRT